MSAPALRPCLVLQKARAIGAAGAGGALVADDDIHGVKSWLVRAKLDPPRQQFSLIARERLLEALDRALAMRLCLIVAPAGFGKTTLLAEWRERLVRRGALAAWLTIDEADGDPKQFLSYLAIALSGAGVAMGRLETLAEQGLMEIAVDSILAAMLEAIAATGAPVVLVLDDYHRMASIDVDGLVCRLMDAAPSNFTLVAAARSRPSLKGPQMLAAGDAMEIDANALRFSLDETRSLLDSRASEDDVAAVFERTEGWAVAIQLARLVISGDRQMGFVLSGLTGHGGHFAAYLTDQVLANLPADLVEFMIETSILERFNAPLANAVCARVDSWAMLKRLEPLHSLLMPLDDRCEWFRYHHLFAEYLQTLLHRRFPDRIAKLHARASEWLRNEGYIADAVRHASLAGDLHRCARMIEEAGGWELILYGGVGHLRSLLRHIPKKELPRFPRVLLARAYLALKDGQIQDARAMVETARVSSPPVGDSSAERAFERDLINIGTLADLYEDRALTRDKLRRLRALQDEIDPVDSLTRGVLCCANALASLAIGDFADAETRSRGAMRAMRCANSVLGLNYCFLHAGGAAFYQGRFQKAEADYSQARQLAEDNFGADSGLRSLADVLHGALLYWRDEWAEGDLVGFDRALAHVENYDGWFEIYAHALDVSVAARLEKGDRDGAEAAIRRGQAIASERGIERLELLAEGHRLACHVYAGEKLLAGRLAADLSAQLPAQSWRRDPHVWRPYCEAGLAIADAIGLADRSAALAVLDDVIACSRSIGANFYLVRTLVRKAVFLYEAGDRPGALAHVIEALERATPERIRKPFRDRPAAPLLRAALKHAREEALDSVILGFIGACLETAPANAARAEALEAFGLSVREMEVLEELAQGASNKEIARALDLTEHTVKFHLKNIFAKLGVERRGQAIALARDPERAGAAT